MLRKKKQVYAFIAEQTKGRIPCVAGIGGNSTLELTQSLKSFDFKGYEAVLSVSPYYNKPSQEGVFRHFMELAHASPKPIILYNVPGRTASNMSAETTLRLVKESNQFIAIKEASGNAEQFMDLIAEAPEGFNVISGDDNLTVPYVLMGMKGVISVLGQAFPKEFSSMVNAALKADVAAATAIHFKLYRIMKAIYLDGNPGGIKALLSQMGICKNVVRLPLVTVNEPTFSRINAALDELK